MYEMLVGYPPFYSDEPMTTCRKVCKSFHYFPYMILAKETVDASLHIFEVLGL